MEDLYLGMWIMAGGTIALAGLTLWLARRAPHWLLDVLGAAVIGVIVAFVYVLRDGIWMARLLPYSNLVVVGNWLPLFAGILAGLVVLRLKDRRLAQVMWGGALLLTSFFAILDPLRGSPPTCHDCWKKVCRGCLVSGEPHNLFSICRQTSQVTCSPAAACTLMAHYGILIHESEMAIDCLTRTGTTWQGLYRGLSLATRDTYWRVEVFETDFETLASTPEPKLLFVELKKGTDYDERYVGRWGWTPGQRHTVVFYQQTKKGALIGDPSVGVEEWSLGDVETLWHGRGMRLVPRDPPDDAT